MQSILQVVSPQFSTAPDISGPSTMVRLEGQMYPVLDVLTVLIQRDDMSADDVASWISRRLADRFVPIPEAN